MNLRSPEEEIDEFLASKPSWLRKILLFDYSLSADEGLAWCNGVEWWQGSSASVLSEYESLVKRSPSRWSEHCARAQKNALRDVPSVPRGRPKKDALADAAIQLQSEGKSPEEIAAIVCDKFTNSTKKGTYKPTPDSIRKLLDSRKPRSRPR